MKTKIGISGAEFLSYHGFYPLENSMGHTFIVDAEVVVNLSHSNSDDLDLTVNYESIYSICRTHMNNPQKLLETVAFHICQNLKSLSSDIVSGRVMIRKKGAQLGGKLDHTFVEMFF
jgi:dihydroneopterin aldolase